MELGKNSKQEIFHVWTIWHPEPTGKPAPNTYSDHEKTKDKKTGEVFWGVISNKVYEGLQKLHIPIEHIDSKDIRELIPDIGFSREERNQHIKRVGHLVSTLQNNSISTIASFVSPYVQSRNIIKEMTVNPIIVYIKADINSCQERDYKGVYEKALSGELENFTGISDVYEEPINPDIIIDTDTMSIEDATNKIVKFVKEKYIK